MVPDQGVSGWLPRTRANEMDVPRAVVGDARLVMYWPSVLASANPLREGQRFVRPSRKDAGCYLCGLRNGVFQVSWTKPGAQLEPFIAEPEHGHRLGAEVDGC